jgi:putative adhesin
MNQLRKTRAKILLLALFLCCASAHAQSELLDKVGGIFDAIADTLDLVGKKSEDVVKPPLGPWTGIEPGDMTGLVQVPRDFNEVCNVGSDATITVANKFGEIRVETWEEQVVRVQAEISVGAESADLASQIVRSIDIRITPMQEGLNVRTNLPDTREMGRTSIEVNCVITVPRDANLVCQNYFGDTILHDIGGAVAVQSDYGAVDLRNIAGPVNVRARNYAVQAYGLEQGGTFEMVGCQVEFSNISGTLRAVNFMGPVILRDLAPETDLDITNANGQIILYVPENEIPGIECEALFGTIRSHIPLDESSMGDLVYARSQNMESQRRLALRTSFEDIIILLEGREDAPQPALQEGAEPFKDVVEKVLTIPEEIEVVIEAISGDVLIEGVDEADLQIKATKLVRLDSPENAPAALQALDLAVESLESRVLVRTTVRDDMEAIGCSYYRVHTVIRCPRTVNLKVIAANGNTVVRGLGELVVVEQGQGSVVVNHCKGTLDLSNQQGDLQVIDCAGPVILTASHGTITTQSVYGKQAIICSEGKTVVDAPKGPIEVPQNGGDVRIVALEGVGGAFDVSVEKGDISIVLSPSSDAQFNITAVNGQVQSSAFPLQGFIKGDVREFTGRLNGGLHEVKLQSKDGDIIID